MWEGTPVGTGSRHAFDEWLGRPITEAPVESHRAVFEHIVGVDLAVAAAYAAQKAFHVLREIDADMRYSYEDIAQDVIVGLTDPLPAEPIRHWRAIIVQNVRWRVLHLRRERLAAMRHPGRRVDYDSAVAQLSDSSAVDDHDRLLAREEIAAALDAVPDPEVRAVLRATFVLPTHDGGYDIRSTAEASELLGISQSKVKRLRASGVLVLRQLLDPQPGRDDGKGSDR